MITYDDVSFRYNQDAKDALQGINFALHSGSFHFLTGPSGSGKTSLMNLLSMGKFPSTGKITMFGDDVSNLSRNELCSLRQKIGVVFQDFRLLNHLSAFDNVALPLRIQNRDTQEIKSHVNELLDWVGLGDHKNNLPHTLSGGQQQRIAIARAVISQPKLLLADEPTGNLDDDIGFRLMGLFEQLNKMGTTIVIATHNTQIISEFGHPCLTLKQGALMNAPNKRKLIAKGIRNAS